MGDDKTGIGVAYDPAALDELERRYWRDIWDTAVYDAVEDYRIDLARFGPVQAGIVPAEPEEPMLNLVLGAGIPGAVEAGHLSDALKWAESHGVDFRVPVTPGRPAAGLAERWLMERGLEQGGSWAKFVRDASPPAFAQPPGIEVFDRGAPNEDDGFADPLAESLGMPYWGATFFFDLPGTEGWCCYVAAAGDDPLAYVAMLVHGEVAQLLFAPAPGARAKRAGDGQAAVLRRCIEDAAAAGCSAIFAETKEPEPKRPSASRLHLLRAGFAQAFTRPEWRPPRHAVAEAGSRGLWWGD